MKWMETPNGKILQPADESTYLPVKSNSDDERMDLVEIFEDNEPRYEYEA